MKVKKVKSSNTLRSALSRLLDGEIWFDLYNCINELVKVDDNDVLSRLIYNLGLLKASPSTDFRECFNFALRLSECRVLANEYEFYDLIERCSNRRKIFDVEIIKIKETTPGFHLATIRMCDNYFNVINHKDYIVKLVVAPLDKKVYRVIVEERPDPFQGNCRLYKFLVSAPYGGEYEVELGVIIKSKEDDGPSARIMLNDLNVIRLEGPRPPGADYNIRIYNFRKEVLILKSQLKKHNFGRIYPASNDIALPTEWNCKEVYANGTVSQLACMNTAKGLAALVLTPPSNKIIDHRLSREKWEELLAPLQNYSHVMQPLGYSPSRRALFLPVPAHGTLSIYLDRIAYIDDTTVNSITGKLKLALKAYQAASRSKHMALYPWNIFVDSTDVKLGLPHYALKRLLASNIDCLDDSKALEEAINLLKEKRQISIERAGENVDIFMDEMLRALSDPKIIYHYDDYEINEFIESRKFERIISLYAELKDKYPGLLD